MGETGAEMSWEQTKRAKQEGGPSLRVLGDDPQLDRASERDENLMLAHGKGDEGAFEELLRRHQRGVFNYIFRMLQNRHVAEEVTQEVFLALVRNAGRYEPTAKFTTYLYAIASHLVSKEWAKRKRRPRFLSLTQRFREDEITEPLDCLADEQADVGGSFEKTEINEAVNRALGELPSHQREAFVLRRFQDLSYEEIAEITQSPVGTLKSRVVRAERALRPLLENFREYVR